MGGNSCNSSMLPPPHMLGTPEPHVAKGQVGKYAAFLSASDWIVGWHEQPPGCLLTLPLGPMTIVYGGTIHPGTAHAIECSNALEQEQAVQTTHG